jgi:hypothetical protein
MTLRNPPGFFDAGLCWWHSKLQRNVFYLTTFENPEAPRPTRAEALRILEKLAQMSEVQNIPGFRNWNEFSKAYEKEIEFYLERWQLTDMATLTFMKGARLNDRNSRATLHQMKREIKMNKRIPYVLLKRSGASAHSWLVSGIEEDLEAGPEEWKLTVIDSNAPEDPFQYSTHGNKYGYLRTDDESSWRVRGIHFNPSGNRMPHLTYYHEDDPMTLFIQNTDDYRFYLRAIRNFCGGETPFTRFEDELQFGAYRAPVRKVFEYIQNR